MSTISSDNGNTAASKGFKISEEIMDDGQCILGALCLQCQCKFNTGKKLRLAIDKLAKNWK